MCASSGIRRGFLGARRGPRFVIFLAGQEMRLDFRVVQESRSNRGAA